MDPKKILELVYGYLNNILADDNYNPHLDTVRHYNTLLSLCKEGLPESFEQEEAIVLSCASNRLSKGPGACGIVIRFPGEKRPGWFSRILPKAKNKTTTAYDTIYEALLFIGNHPERFRKYDYPIQIQIANKTVVEQITVSLLDSEEGLRNKWESVTQGLRDYREIFQREIKVVWRPRKFTIDLKKALELTEKELSKFR